MASRLLRRGAATISRVRKLGEQASIEVSPTTVDAFVSTVDEFRGVDDRLWARRKVFVNMLEASSEGFVGVERAVRLLAQAGHDPVPHLPASVLESRSHAAHVCDRLARCGAKEALILGGNPPRPADGLDASSLGDIARNHFEALVFAAFPDGHPRCALGRFGLRNKLAKFPNAKVVTQWAPTPASTSQWLSTFLDQHPSTRVHIGVCGPASRTKKASFAEFCRVPLHQSSDHRQYDTFEPPRDAVLSLAADLEFYNVPDDGRVTLHLFAIGLGRTLDFLHRLTAHDLKAKSNLLAA